MERPDPEIPEQVLANDEDGGTPLVDGTGVAADAMTNQIPGVDTAGAVQPEDQPAVMADVRAASNEQVGSNPPTDRGGVPRGDLGDAGGPGADVSADRGVAAGGTPTQMQSDSGSPTPTPRT